jgi:hypothetical protein
MEQLALLAKDELPEKKRATIPPKDLRHNLIAVVCEQQKKVYVTRAHVGIHPHKAYEHLIAGAKRRYAKLKEHASPMETFLATCPTEPKILQENLPYDAVETMREVYEEKLASKGYAIIERKTPTRISSGRGALPSVPKWTL